MLQKSLSILLAAVLLLGCMSPVFAEEPQPHWGENALARMEALGLFSGHYGEDYQPDDLMTRAMFVTVLGRMVDANPEFWDRDDLTLIFSDVDPDAYYAPYLSWAVHTGVVSGSGHGLFGPDELLTREQMAQMIANFLVVSGTELEPPSLANALQTGAQPENEAKLNEPEPGPDTEAAPAETLAVITPEMHEAAEAARETEAPAEQASDGSAAPEDAPAAQSGLALRTRDNSLQNVHRQMLGQKEAPLETEALLMGYFTDAADIAPWARVGVCLLVSQHVIGGRLNPDGGYRFDPQDGTTRAECAVLICRLLDLMRPAAQVLQDPVSLVLNDSYLELEVDAQTNLVASVFPMDVSNQTVVWYAEDPEILSVDIDGGIVALAPGETVVHAVCSNLIEELCVVRVMAPPEPEPEPETEAPTEPETEAPAEAETEAPAEPEPEAAIEAPDEPETVRTIGSADMSEHEKDLMIFGQDVADPRLYYSSDDAALAHQTVIVVKTWDLAEDGTKYTRTWNLQVHENIAATAQAIFDEIYEHPEMPVIHSMGGWRPNAGKSEHQPGLAIDINWLENYYCDPNGKAITGYYFKPGEDPYSIPVGGAIDQIFSKYGFIRGINWRSGYRDYMHYSFYGT